MHNLGLVIWRRIWGGSPEHHVYMQISHSDSSARACFVMASNYPIFYATFCAASSDEPILEILFIRKGPRVWILSGRTIWTDYSSFLRFLFLFTQDLIKNTHLQNPRKGLKAYFQSHIDIHLIVTIQKMELDACMQKTQRNRLSCFSFLPEIVDQRYHEEEETRPVKSSKSPPFNHQAFGGRHPNT